MCQSNKIYTNRGSQIIEISLCTRLSQPQAGGATDVWRSITEILNRLYLRNQKLLLRRLFGQAPYSKHQKATIKMATNLRTPPCHIAEVNMKQAKGYQGHLVR